MNYNIIFCPQCGKDSLGFNGKNQYHCPECTFTFYRNVAAAAAAIILCEGKILFTVRAKDPQKGLLGLPGGFIDSDENAQSGLMREVREEIGIELTEMKYLCNECNKYHYRGVTYDTLDFYFTAEADSLALTLDEREVADIRLIAPEDIDFEQIAFESCKEALKKLKKTLI